MISFLQDLNVTTSTVKDIEEIAMHTFPFVHPEELDPFQRAHLFSAVIGQNGKLINVKEYISYNKSDVSYI